MGFTKIQLMLICWERKQQPKAKWKVQRQGSRTFFINNRWCNPGYVTVNKICRCDIKLLLVSLWPYVMLMEILHAIVIGVGVYIPSWAFAETVWDNTQPGLPFTHLWIAPPGTTEQDISCMLIWWMKTESLPGPTRKISSQPGLSTPQVKATSAEATHYHTLENGLPSKEGSRELLWIYWLAYAKVLRTKEVSNYTSDYIHFCMDVLVFNKTAAF